MEPTSQRGGRRAKEQPDHAAIIREHRAFRKEVMEALGRFGERQNSFAADIVEIKAGICEAKDGVAGVSKAIGHETRRWEGDQETAEGLVGEIIRLRRRVNERFTLYDRVQAAAVAIFGTISVFLAVIWWLVKDRVGAIFH